MLFIGFFAVMMMVAKVPSECAHGCKMHNMRCLMTMCWGDRAFVITLLRLFLFSPLLVYNTAEYLYFSCDGSTFAHKTTRGHHGRGVRQSSDAE